MRQAIAFLKAHRVTFSDSIPRELYPGVDYTAFALDPDGHCIQIIIRIRSTGMDVPGRPPSDAARTASGPTCWSRSPTATSTRSSKARWGDNLSLHGMKPVRFGVNIGLSRMSAELTWRPLCCQFIGRPMTVVRDGDPLDQHIQLEPSMTLTRNLLDHWYPILITVTASDNRSTLAPPVSKASLRLVIFRLRITSTKANLETTFPQEVGCRSLPRNEHRMAEAVVRHIGADRRVSVASAALTRAGIGAKEIGGMIRDGQPVIAEVLDFASLFRPYVLIERVDQLVEDLVARRERWGMSYFAIFEPNIDVFAPIVSRLAGG